ncbi:MAG: hypothetical protein ABJF10_12155 [Chthoniobacter sp.]|uniref:hypothetical protein n=1 Tax=Chthoniobacter sp. TaxID=2510640 RepID=UPI0032AB4491
MNFVAAILYAVCTSSLVAMVLAAARGGLNSAIAAAALGCGLLVMSLALWQGRNPSAPRRAPSTPEWLAIIAFALVSLRIFLWVVTVKGDDIKVLSPNNLGDFSLHLTYVRYLASGVPFWPDNPIFTGGKLTYPIGIDLFHSLLPLVGMDVFRGFIWMGIIGAALTGAALWRWGRGFALFGFLANGGLAGFLIFSTGKLADFQGELPWKSFALALFATQRGLLFALPAGLLLLSSWRTRFFAGQAEDWRLPFWGELLLYASLPLFHFHTFLFLSALLGVWFVFQAPARRGLALLVGSAFVPATVLVFLITGGLKGGSLLGGKAGWMWDDTTFLDWCQIHLGNGSPTVAAITFWPVNFGILPLLVVMLIVALSRQGGSQWARLVVIPSLAIFIICCFVKFAPWAWDNTKLMIWSYLAILPFVWTELLVRWPAWARCFIVGMLFFSGFISTLGGIDASFTGYPIALRSELDGVAKAVHDIPVTDRFAGAPTYNHPLLLNGRKMVLGYLGHVDSHGLAWQEPAGKLDSLMNGEDGWRELADELGARYLFWGRYEDEKYKDSPQPWRLTTRMVASGDWGAIFDLHTPPTTPTRLPAMNE